MTDPLEVLRHVGGRELAAMLGAILAARLRRVPVLLDGFTTTVPAAVLQAIEPAAAAHCQIGHCSAEPGHRRLVEQIGLTAAARPRHAAGRGLRGRRRDPARPRGSSLPQRHGDVRQCERQPEGMTAPVISAPGFPVAGSRA